MNTATHDSQTYTVRLEVFQGPLDLLLRLIEARELDITALSLAAVADQFIEHMSANPPAPQILAEFLSIACRLLVIKALALFAEKPADPEAEVAAHELTQSLERYRAVREAAVHLKDREQAGLRAHPRPSAYQLPLFPTLAPGITLEQLVRALETAIARLPEQAAEITVPLLRYSVAEKTALMISLLREQHSLALSSLLRAATCRPEMVALFLAVLELLRRGTIAVVQDELFGEIGISPGPHMDEQQSDCDTEGID